MVISVAGEAVSIKGTRNGLVIIFNPDRDIEEIKSTLKHKMEKSGGFFKGAKFSVYDSCSRKDHSFVGELEGICRQYGLIPSGEVTWPPQAADKTQGDHPQSRRKGAEVIPIRQQAGPEGEQALLVMRTLRSGQKVSSRRTVVVMGDVNPGAEVISEGSILVLGSCKGNVHAGYSGNLLCQVAALRLQPVTLRIGTIQADTPDLPVTASPLAARVVRGKITFREFSGQLQPPGPGKPLGPGKFQ